MPGEAAARQGGPPALAAGTRLIAWRGRAHPVDLETPLASGPPGHVYRAWDFGRGEPVLAAELCPTWLPERLMRLGGREGRALAGRYLALADRLEQRHRLASLRRREDGMLFLLLPADADTGEALAALDPTAGRDATPQHTPAASAAAAAGALAAVRLGPLAFAITLVGLAALLPLLWPIVAALVLGGLVFRLDGRGQWHDLGIAAFVVGLVTLAVFSADLMLGTLWSMGGGGTPQALRCASLIHGIAGDWSWGEQHVGPQDMVFYGGAPGRIEAVTRAHLTCPVSSQLIGDLGGLPLDSVGFLRRRLAWIARLLPVLPALLMALACLTVLPLILSTLMLRLVARWRGVWIPTPRRLSAHDPVPPMLALASLLVTVLLAAVLVVPFQGGGPTALIGMFVPGTAAAGIAGGLLLILNETRTRRAPMGVVAILTGLALLWWVALVAPDAGAGRYSEAGQAMRAREELLPVVAATIVLWCLLLTAVITVLLDLLAAWRRPDPGGAWSSSLQRAARRS